MSAEELAAILSVSRRTLTSEIAALQDLLGTSASVWLTGGRYRLLIADPLRYRAVRAGIEDASVSFNDPGTRVSYIVGRLFRAHVPVLIEGLASAMSVGRTTVVADLGRVRSLLDEAGLRIEGRPNVGLSLVGPELQQRLHVLRWHFGYAYPDEPWMGRVGAVVRGLAREAGVDRAYAAELVRWSSVVIDRAATGRALAPMPPRYASLTRIPAFELATTLAGRLADEFGVDLGPDDILFLTLPVAGMRAPGGADADLPGREVELLVDDVLSAVRTEMDIDLGGSEFLAEFARHLIYMVNRMRYRVWVDDSGVANIGHEFPVAHRMATISARVVEERLGLSVEESELGFLAAYFQVFLDGRERRDDASPQVVIVASAGKVEAELVSLQLAKLLPPSARFQTLPLADAVPESLEGADLVVVTGPGEVRTEAPTLNVTRVFDRAGLARQLERLRLHIPLRSGLGAGDSVLASACGKQRFFALPPGTDYAEAVEYMTGHLEARGQVEEGFGERIREREERAIMQLDPWVGFPHATLVTQSSVMLAVGVVPREPDEAGVRLIVLLGVPEKGGRSEDVLVQVYDEVLRLGARRDLLARICLLGSYEQFYYFLERNPITERQR